jgi:hypothetical protein
MVFVGCIQYSGGRDGGAKEISCAPIECDLHPEFGYVGSANLRRKLDFVLAFLVFGLIAGASGVAVFMVDLDRDPKHAMALAPPETLDGATSSIARETPETEAAEAALAQTPSKPARRKAPCRESIRENSAVDCTSGKERKPRSILAINERPAIAAAPIGHRVDPTVLPAESPAPVVAPLPQDAVTATPTEIPSEAPTFPASLPEGAVTATSTDAVTTPPASLPAVAPKRAQRHQREHHEYASTLRHHREHRDYASTTRYYSNRQVYQSAGYARLW